MDQTIPMRNRGRETLVQEEPTSKAENAVKEREEGKLVQIEKVVDDHIEEEDIIIMCELDKMVRCFFKEYIIVWHDPNVDSEENKQYITQLERFCEVHTFTEWEKAVLCIQTAKVACHVITSGTNGELLVKEICSSQNALEIYVFCENKDSHLTWTKNYQKVLCVENNIQSVLDQIKQNLLKWYKKESSLKNNLPAFVPIFNDWDKSLMNNLHRFLKVIPNFKNRSQAKSDLMGLSRAIYSDKINASLMKEFEESYNKYHKNTILKWYTQESFLYKVTNNCLRIASCDSIQYCRLALKGLERAIKNQYREKSRHFSGMLYRAASLSGKEWSSLKANLNREIEMHGFLSVSKDKNQALKFIQMDESKNVFLTILVPRGPNDEDQGFAEVEEFSRFSQEKEVIFNVRSRFTVLEADDKYSEDIPYRHLVLFYGAQGFRKYIGEKFPLQGRSILNAESISCSICRQDGIVKNMYFRSLVWGQTQRYLCKKCLPEFLEVDPVPLLCIPQGKPLKQIKLQGVFMTYPMNLEVPMYGYQCFSCQIRMKKMYYKCAECPNETKKMWCDDCIEVSSECMHRGHDIILEKSPFSFWCEKISQREIDHLKFHSRFLESSGPFQQGKMYVESHEYQKAIVYYKTYIQKDKDNKNNMTLAIANKYLADVYRLQADHKSALEFYSKALEIIKSIYGDNHTQAAECYALLGQVNENQAEYQKSLENYFKALEIVKSFYGDNHPAVVKCYCNLGNLYMCQAEYQKALEYYEKTLKIGRFIYGDNHPNVATSYGNLGNICYSQADYQRAFEYHSKALEINKSVYGENHLNVATSYIHIGGIYQSQAEYQKALEYFSKGLGIRKSFYGDNHPEVATSYSSLGNISYDQADYQNALEYYSKALEIDRSVYGDNHPKVAISYGNLGNISYNQADYQKALEYYSKGLGIRKLFYGDNHPEVATSYSSLGNISCDQADYQRAFECHSKALEIYKSFYGENHPNVATSYRNLGNIYRCQAKYQKALEYHSKALGIRKSFYGDNHPEVATSYSSLGNICFYKADYQNALEYYSKALEIRKSFYGDNHPDVETFYGNIGYIYENKAEYQKALEYYLKALEIRKSFFGNNDPDTIAVENRVQALSKDLGKEKNLSFEEHVKELK